MRNMTNETNLIFLGISGMVITTIMAIIGVYTFGNSYFRYNGGIPYFVIIGVIFLVSLILFIYNVHKLCQNRYEQI